MEKHLIDGETLERFNCLFKGKPDYEEKKELVEKFISTHDLFAGDHREETRAIYKFIEDLDFVMGDRFCFKSGGDGDNGEILMHYLDYYFETEGRDKLPEKLKKASEEKDKKIAEQEQALNKAISMFCSNSCPSVNMKAVICPKDVNCIQCWKNYLTGKEENG